MNSTGFTVTIVNPTDILLREIADKRLHRRDVAQTMGLAFRFGQAMEIDWPVVTAAIRERWSDAAIVWIKEQAWKFAKSGEATT